MRFNPIQNAFLSTDDLSIQDASALGEVEDAYRAWKIAIASMAQYLQLRCHTEVPEAIRSESESLPLVEPLQGLILSGPTPVLHHPSILTHFQTCFWIPRVWTRHQPQLLPCDSGLSESPMEVDFMVPLEDSDPLLLEQFCVVLTPSFCWAALLSHSPHSAVPFFGVTFAPETLQKILFLLLDRVHSSRPGLMAQLRQWLIQFPPQVPDYRVPMQFGRIVLQQSAQSQEPSVLVDLASEAGAVEHSPVQEDLASRLDIGITTREKLDKQQVHRLNRSGISAAFVEGAKSTLGYDIELLKAIAHEIRTPLATIQTLTRLLIRRKDLPEVVIQRLDAIQQECTHQIDRFSLIFRAIELTTTPSASLNHSLTSISLQQLLTQKLARWKMILEQRSLEFEVQLPDDLPAISIRDPNMLDQVLTGLIEQLSHTLPFGSRILLCMTLAGEQLKLQLRSVIPAHNDQEPYNSRSMLKAVGQLLMLQPETGSLSLSLPATKEIFNFLGGKLTVRQSPPRGEVLTMFLPLDPLMSRL